MEKNYVNIEEKIKILNSQLPKLLILNEQDGEIPHKVPGSLVNHLKSCHLL